MYSGIWSRSSESIFAAEKARLARLVVPDDPARAERVDVDAVDLPGEREAAQVEPALQLGAASVRCRTRPRSGAGRAGPPPRPRRGRSARGRARAGPRSSRRSRSVSSWRTPSIASLEAAGAGSGARPRGARPRPARCPPPWGGPAKKRWSVVWAIDPRSFASTSASIERGEMHALDEPDRRARGERLELGDVEARPLRASAATTAGLVRARSGARKRGAGALQAALPAVGGGERLGLAGVAGGERRDGPEALPLGRRLLERPRQRRERPPPRPAAHLGRVEERPHLVPERARQPRGPVVGRRLPDEVEPARRPRAGGVEEVALAGDGLGPHEARARSARRAPGGCRRRGRATEMPRRGKLPSSSPSTKTTSKRRVRARSEVEDGDPPGLRSRGEPDRQALERAEDVLAGRARRSARASPRARAGAGVIASKARRSSREASPTGGASSP